MLSEEEREEILITQNEATSWAYDKLKIGMPSNDIRLVIALALLTGESLTKCSNALTNASAHFKQAFNQLSLGGKGGSGL